MAKMFYTLEEVAQKLGKSTEDVKQMADNGKLQLFRDGEKTMFKCSQVDAMAGADRLTLTGESNSMLDVKGDTNPDLMGTGITIFDSDQIKSAGDSMASSGVGMKTGSTAIELAGRSEPVKPVDAPISDKVSVFDPDEVREADSMAATQADAKFNMKDEDLALESVGSGSGLLDLTRETDDTSLGAELLDEIYPSNNTESQDIKMDTAAIGSTGIFDSNLRNTAKVQNESNGIGESSGSAFGSLSDTGSSTAPVFSSNESSFQASISADTGAGAPAMQRSKTGSAASPAPKTIVTPSSLQMVAPVEYVEEEDPTGSMFMAITLFFAMAACLLGLFAIIPSLAGIPGKLTTLLFDGSKQSSSLPVAFGALLVLGLITGILGFVLRSKKQEA